MTTNRGGGAGRRIRYRLAELVAAIVLRLGETRTFERMSEWACSDDEPPRR